MNERQIVLYNNFVKKSISLYGDKYDYSFIDNYTTNKSKVKIYCKTHNHFFWVEPKRHYLENRGCELCSGYKWNSKIFIEKSRKIHGNSYNYSLVEYINNDTPVKIICDQHGIFTVTPKEHTYFKHKCKGCYLKNLYDESTKNKTDYFLYKHLVEKITNKNYTRYKDIINPNGHNRNRREYHIDHKFSIFDGFKFGILPIIIGSVHNLEIIKYDQNIRKSKKSSISLDDLLSNKVVYL